MYKIIFVVSLALLYYQNSSHNMMTNLLCFLMQLGINDAAYPAPPTSYPPQGQAPYSAPPPLGYPTNNTAAYPQQVPAETKNRGDDDGFWKGW